MFFVCVLFFLCLFQAFLCFSVFFVVVFLVLGCFFVTEAPMNVEFKGGTLPSWGPVLKKKNGPSWARGRSFCCAQALAKSALDGFWGGGSAQEAARTLPEGSISGGVLAAKTIHF